MTSDLTWGSTIWDDPTSEQQALRLARAIYEREKGTATPWHDLPLDERGVYYGRALRARDTIKHMTGETTHGEI